MEKCIEKKGKNEGGIDQQHTLERHLGRNEYTIVYDSVFSFSLIALLLLPVSRFLSFLFPDFSPPPCFLISMNNASIELVTIESSGKMSPDPRHSEISGPISGSDVPSHNFLQLEDSDDDGSPEDEGYELLNANELDNYDDDEDMAHGNHFNLSQPSSGTSEPPMNHRLHDGSDDETEPSDPSENSDSCQLTPGTVSFLLQSPSCYSLLLVTVLITIHSQTKQK